MAGGPARSGPEKQAFTQRPSCLPELWKFSGVSFVEKLAVNLSPETKMKGAHLEKASRDPDKETAGDGLFKNLDRCFG